MVFGYQPIHDHDERHTHHRILRKSIPIAIILICICILLVVTFWTKPDNLPPSPFLIISKNGAVATEVDKCSNIGVDILKDGGSAVDAAIAAELCVGTINAFSAGIGGGGLMLIRSPNGTAEIIDFRETAPLKATKNMFVGTPKDASIGVRSVAVPGEIRGMKLAHERYGKLPWERLFKPSIKLSREGFAIGPELALRLELYKHDIENNAKTNLSVIYAPSGKVLKENDILYRLNFSETLETISKNYSEFYEGRIAKALVEEIQSRGGIMQEDDFKNYRAKIREPLISNYRGRKIITTPEPTSGPSLIFMLNLLEDYEMSKNRLDVKNFHRIAEVMKFGFARRTELCDPEFVPEGKETVKQHEDRIKEIMSKEYAASIQTNISDDHTFPVGHYDPKYDQPEDHGTTHISVIDKDGMAVSLTSTVNLIWGSQVLNLETGILLNDEMDDFSIPGRSNSFGLEPSPYNYIAPGKRPLSSTVPTIVENEDGKLELVAGGSGGSRILTAILQVLLNVFDFDMNLEEAIDSLRIHHQLVPNSIGVERGFEYKLVDELIDKKHVVQIYDQQDRTYSCQVQAVRQFKNTIHAASDKRKHGKAAGY